VWLLLFLVLWYFSYKAIKRRLERGSSGGDPDLN
jgi:hypothetical protein